ncbi:universal stress protein [Mycobacterium servetii]|uniref:Universal stress protein n=1 Tax=Mycobacterium servetii TaxID=3237418 RepID=A0ABV4C4T3_9MYCO
MWQPPRGAVLVGVDGSAAALGAVRWAAHDAALHRVPLVLVHVIDAALPEWFEVAALTDFGQRQQRRARGFVESAIKVAEESTDGHGPVHIEGKVLTSATIPTLVGLSAQAAMVVVGYRRRDALARSVLGSVSSALVYHAQCPVAVIHDREARGAAVARAPVLVGIDGSAASEAATAIAFQEASRRGVGLVALHAWTEPWASGSGRFQNAHWDAQLSEQEATLAERLAGWQDRHPEVTIRRRLEIGDPASCLIDASEQAQLIVVGSHGCGRLRGALLGSVGAAVVSRAKIPVIVARRW